MHTHRESTCTVARQTKHTPHATSWDVGKRTTLAYLTPPRKHNAGPETGTGPRSRLRSPVSGVPCTGYPGVRV